MIYLYIKTHNITGLKYFGKTTKDPQTYKGSGKYWKLHIKKHGYDVTTAIIFQSESKEKIKEMGLHYSKLWDVVNSEKWANLIEENGDGGDVSNCIDYKKRNFNGENNPFYNKKHKEETKKKMGVHRIGIPPTNKGVPMTEEQKAKMKGKRGPMKIPKGKVGPSAALKAWETKRKTLQLSRYSPHSTLSQK